MSVISLLLAVALANPPANATIAGQATEVRLPAAPSAEESARARAAMLAAAKAFVESLGPEGRKMALRHFEVSERVTWSYLPGERPGLFLADMTPVQREKAMALVESALSEDGKTKIRRTLFTESLRRQDLEKQGTAKPAYGEERYAILVFGTPGEEPWGFRFEGHHIVLHFSSVSGEVTSTPLFFGAFPATLREGPEKGTRPLGATQDVALELRRSLSAEQAKRASVGDAAPADILTGPDHPKDLRDPAAGGVAMADLTQAQRELLWGIVLRHALDLRGDLASDELRRIKAAGVEAIRFGFAGEPALDKPHYYRIVGPTFVIEFDCSAGNPEHVHCVWHDPARDFGGELLRDHLRREHAPPPAGIATPGVAPNGSGR